MIKYIFLTDTKFEPHNGTTELCKRKTSRRHSQSTRIVRLMEDLKSSLELCDEKSKVMNLVPSEITSYIRKWMIGVNDCSVAVSLFNKSDLIHEYYPLDFATTCLPFNEFLFAKFKFECVINCGYFLVLFVCTNIFLA